MRAESKKVGFTHYERVYAVLKNDNMLKQRLGNTTVAVCRPDNTHKDFPIEVAQVVDEINNRGLDIVSMAKSNIIHVAHSRLIDPGNPMTTQNDNTTAVAPPVKSGRGRPSKAVVAARAAAAAAAAASTQLAEAAPVKRRRGRPPKASVAPENSETQKVKRVPKVKAVGIAADDMETQAPVKSGRGRPSKAVVAARAAAASTQLAEAAPVKRRRGRPPKASVAPENSETQKVKRVPDQPKNASLKAKGGLKANTSTSSVITYVRKFVPYVVGLAALSNMQAVQTLLEPFITAGDTDALDVSTKVNLLVDEMYARLIIPESPKQTAA